MPPLASSVFRFCWGPFLLRSRLWLKQLAEKMSIREIEVSLEKEHRLYLWGSSLRSTLPYVHFQNLIFQCTSSMCHSERQKMKIFWGSSVSKDPESNVLGLCHATQGGLASWHLASPSSFSDSIAPLCFSCSVDSWHNRQYGIVFCSVQRDRVALHSDVPFFSSMNCPPLSLDDLSQ